MTKRWLEKQQDDFAKYIFIKDGCPESEAKNYTWDDVVEHFYDGDEEVAYQDFLDHEAE